MNLFEQILNMDGSGWVDAPPAKDYTDLGYKGDKEDVIQLATKTVCALNKSIQQGEALLENLKSNRKNYIDRLDKYMVMILVTETMLRLDRLWVDLATRVLDLEDPEWEWSVMTLVIISEYIQAQKEHFNRMVKRVWN